MALVRSFGRRTHATPTLASEAIRIVAEPEFARASCAIRIVANGSAADYHDWIAIAFEAPSEVLASRCADSFSRKLTRLGAVLLKPVKALVVAIAAEWLCIVGADDTLVFASFGV